MLHKQLTLIVISILWLLNPTIVVGSQFMDWVDSITYCPECSSHSQPLNSGTEISTVIVAPSTGTKPSVFTPPSCAKPTPSVFKKPDVPKAKDWIIGDIRREDGGRVNDGSEDCSQVTDVNDIDLNVPDELKKVIANHGQVALVDNNRSSIGVVTSCDRDGTINFVGGNSSQPAKDSKGKGTGIIVLPPGGKRMVPRSTLGNTLATHQIPTNKCNVCDNTTSVFVLKQEFVKVIAQVFQKKSTSEVYSSGILPKTWKDKTERLYQDELDKVMPGIISACQQSSACSGSDSGGIDKANRFFNCAENLYSDYFPGPVQTEELPYQGDTLYLRNYTLSQCGPCGQFASESSLAAYQSDAYYAFDNDWQYLDSLDNVLSGSGFCQGW